MPPKLSIIVPNYNYGRYLELAISSVAESSYNSFEIILIDDGSDDQSVKIAETLSARYPVIRFYRNETNKGLFYTIKKGFSLIRGEYVHFLSSDDFRLPGFIDKTMDALEKFPDVSLCCSDHVYFSEEDIKNLKFSSLLKTRRNIHRFSAEELRVIFRRSNFWIPGHTTILKKTVFEKYGWFDENLGCYCDWFLLHHVALKEGIVYIPEKLAAFRLHKASYATHDMFKRNQELSWKLIKKLKNEQSLGSLFLNSSLLRPFAKTLFWNLLKDPFKWKFFVSLFLKSIEYRLSTIFKIHINQKILDRLNLDIKI